MTRVNIRPSRLSNRPVYEPAATRVFDPLTELKRLVSCCLLGEDQFYVDGAATQERIFELAHRVQAADVVDLAVDARTNLGLRHVPLWLLVALANRQDGGHGALIRTAASQVLRTPRDALDLVALYWKDGRKPLPWSFKRSLLDGFERWSDFQLRRYATLGRTGKAGVRLRDLMRLVHPVAPRSAAMRARALVFTEIAKDTIVAPSTWESMLPLARTKAEKRAVWEQLLTDNRLGALALVRNLRNMEEAGVVEQTVALALAGVRAEDVWPWQVLTAARHTTHHREALEELMVRSAGRMDLIAGYTGILVDVSGSMDSPLSKAGEMTRMDAASGLAILLREVCLWSSIATFSNRLVGVDKEMCGLALDGAISTSQPHQSTQLGPAMRAMMEEIPIMDRLIVLTDEQAQVGLDRGLEMKVYMVNLGAYQRGVEFLDGAVRINGWSGGVVRFIAEHIAGRVAG